MVVGAHRVAHDRDVERVGQPVAELLPGARRRRGSATPGPWPPAGSASSPPLIGKTKIVSGCVRVDDDREAERRRQPVGDGGPGRAVVVGAVDAAVVLQVQPLGAARVPGDLVDALAELGVLLALGQELGADAVVARLPGSLRRRWSGRRRRTRARRSPTAGPSGCGSTVWNAWPPKPAPQSGRCGWSQSARSSANVSPRSVDLQTAPGSVPAYTTPSSRPAPAARPARPWRRCPRGSGSRRSGSPARSRRGRRSARPAGRASSTRRRRAAAGVSPRVSTRQE